MLPSENRLLKRVDFSFVKREGKKYYSNLFGLMVRQTGSDVARFGFVVTAKVLKKATERNRAKRVLREAIRRNILRIKQGFDVVFLIRKDLLLSSFNQVESEVKRLLMEAGVSDK